MTQIKDGRGRGFVAAVNANNKLDVLAATESEIGFHSRVNAEGFFFQLPEPVAVPAGVDVLVAWGLSLETTRILRVEQVFIGWNGGDTNRNRALEVAVYQGTERPTANGAQLDPAVHHTGNMNLASARAPLFDYLYWDGVGSGMTTADVGLQVYRDLLPGPDRSVVDFRGALIMVPQAILAFVVKAEEAGVVSFHAHAWLQETAE